MERRNSLEKLAQAEKHVQEGRKIVGRQRAHVARLKGGGYDVSEAEKLLKQFESSLAIFEDHHRAIRKELGMAADANPSWL
jgi:hypothetical protein